ncbi:UNVERIFIED_CONTAM: hypothetical protein Slati_3215000 [Sesamum latifolium]|uniref:Uncharacterized protein n=1 Tax=Sesamum latifolium TaxID=2727402 RepID=A0AAW2V0I9_9LAMI
MEEWVVQVDQRVSQTSTAERQADRNTTSIYRVPREEHVTFVCKPSRVSFGPYYNGDLSCSQTEERKDGSLIHFLRMMILDGCFLIEVLRSGTNYYSGDHHSRKNPVFGMEGIHGSEKKYYRLDMLLLLLKLVSVERGNDSLIEAAGHINKLVARFFSNLDFPTTDQGNQYLHVLHLYRQCLINKASGPLRLECTTVFYLDIPSATELHKVGIGFAVSKTRSLHKDAGHDFMSYIFFMFRLIQTPSDVSLLQLHGIIETSLRRNEVAILFNVLRRSFTSATWLAAEHHVVGRKLRERYETMSDEWRQDLFQKYLRSPWAVISVVAAILVFILTTIQTVFTVLGFICRN